MSTCISMLNVIKINHVHGGESRLTEQLVSHLIYKSYGAFSGHGRLRICIVSTSASNGKWQVGAEFFFIIFSSLNSSIKKN